MSNSFCVRMSRWTACGRFTKPRVDDRRVLSGIVFVNRNGLRWRDAPSAYGESGGVSGVFSSVWWRSWRPRRPSS
jgi:transposase